MEDDYKWLSPQSMWEEDWDALYKSIMEIDYDALYRSVMEAEEKFFNRSNFKPDTEIPKDQA
jgi:hypothetical protein